MRGNDVVLKLHEKLDEVLIMFKIEFFAQAVAPDLNTSQRYIEQ